MAAHSNVPVEVRIRCGLARLNSEAELLLPHLRREQTTSDEDLTTVAKGLALRALEN